MKKLISFLLPVSMFLMSSCDKDDDTPPDPNVNFAATLTGAAETPANASAATGSSTGTYNTNTKILTVTTTYSGITPSAGHIHLGAVGVKGDVVFPFVAPLTSPIVFTSTPLSADQESSLMSGLYYVNLHTAAFPGGEIRGQLIKQ